MTISLVMAGMGGLALCLLSPTRATGTGSRDDTLPFAVRHAIDQQMVGHGGDVAGLVQASLMLNFPIIKNRAGALMEARTIPRPAPGERYTLSAAIPAHFFDLQDQLKRHARALAIAAHRQDRAGVGRELGQTIQACVDCHAAYLWNTEPDQSR